MDAAQADAISQTNRRRSAPPPSYLQGQQISDAL